jgi:hypothetical protein
MKKVLILSLMISSQAFALVTDYTCTLIEKNNVTSLTVNALISRSGMKSNGDYTLMASNNFGYELEVSVYDNNLKKTVLRGTKKLAGAGYIDGDAIKGEKGQKNPKEIGFVTFDQDLGVKCLRADDIEYPKH